MAGRKGTLGSPFAITDFRAVDPELGSEADFVELIEAAHAIGLRVILDVVFNHTAPDSHLLQDHPEFYHRDSSGRPVSSMPQWTDIIDLAHPHDDLSRYLFDSLAVWVARGVDGFRCDSAALTPLSFWREAHDELEVLKPGLLWLAESVHPNLVEARRAAGYDTASDAELFSVFDMEYTYDVWPIWQSAVIGTVPVSRYLEMLRWQDASYPANYVKLRHVENHDNYRIMRFAGSREQALAWTALTAFLKGAFMIYAGQESGTSRWPTLFDRDPIEWGLYPFTRFMQRLTALKKHPALVDGQFRILADEPTVQLAWARRRGSELHPPASGPGLFGVFDVGGVGAAPSVPLPDGSYHDWLSDTEIEIKDGRVEASAFGYVFEFTSPVTAPDWESPLLDVFLHVEHAGDDELIHRP